MDNERFSQLITHPVLSTFITLKSQKFSGIFETNFFIFMFFYIVPFFVMLFFLAFEDMMESVTKVEFFYHLWMIIPLYCLFTTMLLTIREAFQMFFMNKSIEKYLSIKSNQIEIIIIVCSWMICLGFYSNFDEDSVQFAMAIFIIFGKNKFRV